jgi:hypothetical protein
MQISKVVKKEQNLIMLALVIPPIAVAFLAFYFLRSSKEMPKNWKSFVVELKIQSSGAIGMIQDIALRYRNKVGG